MLDRLGETFLRGENARLKPELHQRWQTIRRERDTIPHHLALFYSQPERILDCVTDEQVAAPTLHPGSRGSARSIVRSLVLLMLSRVAELLRLLLLAVFCLVGAAGKPPGARRWVFDSAPRDQHAPSETGVQALRRFPFLVTEPEPGSLKLKMEEKAQVDSVFVEQQPQREQQEEELRAQTSPASL